MKFLVLGHICLDTIQQQNGRSSAGGQSYGGIFFSLAALANLTSADDTIYPVFGVGKNDYDSLIERLRKYPCVNSSGIYAFDGPTNRVTLLYQDGNRRVECSKHIAAPILYEKIELYPEVDAILANMVSGFDLTLETLEKIRKATQPRGIPLHIDIHSLTLGIREDYTRFHRPLESWRQWCSLADAVQMNAEEAANLTVERLSESELATQMLNLGVRGFIITRGPRGATIFYQGSRKIERKDIPPIPIKHCVDSTGCGDVFAAAFCYQYLQAKDAVVSTEFANRVAAINATFRGSREIDLIAQHLNVEREIK